MSTTEMLGTAQSNGRATMGRAPIYRLMLSGESLDEATIYEATITLGENIHDTVTMTVSSSERTTTDGILESPISFFYGSASKTELFCGYVTEIVEEQTQSGVLTWTMQMTGPTKTMQLGRPRFWSQRTVPSAVETLAYLGYLGYAGHAFDHVWPSLAQTDSSDWQMAVSLASRLGWSIYNRYGIVMLHDPMELFKNNGVSAVLISESYNLAKDGLDEERSLLEFAPEEESETSADQQGYKVAYFNDEGVQVAMQKGDHSSYKFLNGFVIRNAREAEIYVNAKDSDASHWPQKAKARILGNANLYPGMSVDIMTTSAVKYAPRKFNGRWLLRGVQHKMDKQTFQTNLMLARPDSTTQVYDGAYSPFWQTLGRARPTLMLSGAIAPGMMQPMGIPGGLVPAPGSGGTIPIGLERWPTILPSVEAGVWVSSWTNPTVRDVS